MLMPYRAKKTLEMKLTPVQQILKARQFAGHTGTYLNSGFFLKLGAKNENE
jgi:hypothetical protein